MSSADDGGPQPTAHESDEFGRRGFLRRGAAAGTAIGGLAIGGSHIAPRYSPVGRAAAFPPAIVVGAVGAAVAGTAINWAVQEGFEALASDDVPEGLTADALKEEVYQTALTRQSTNASTFVDNKNMLDGLSNVAYGDGKMAAIEALNAQKSQSEVETAAVDAVDSQAATVKENFLKGWNESVNELEVMYNTAESHSDVGYELITAHKDDVGQTDYVTDYQEPYPSFGQSEFTLPDGSAFDLRQIQYSSSEVWDPTHDDLSSDDMYHWIRVSHTDTVNYLDFSKWNEIWSKITTEFDNVRDGLLVWVDSVYGEVQAGELDTSELMTPREIAAATANEENINRALADLMALNIPVDFEREATIEVENADAGTTITISGALAVTSEPADGMPAGETYDPSALDYDVYINYDVTQGGGLWTNYNAPVDGGVVTFTSEPVEGVVYKINTIAGESATAVAGDFEANSDSTAWTVDVSDQLEEAITEVEDVEMSSQDGETQYELLRLTQPFTILTYEDSEGNEYDNADFTQDEPQDDTNYITQEEWEELQKRNEELIKKYEEAKEDNNDDDGIDIGLPSFGLGDGAGGLLGLGLIGVVVLAVVGVVTDAIPGLGN